MLLALESKAIVSPHAVSEPWIDRYIQPCFIPYYTCKNDFAGAVHKKTPQPIAPMYRTIPIIQHQFPSNLPTATDCRHLGKIERPTVDLILFYKEQEVHNDPVCVVNTPPFLPVCRAETISCGRFLVCDRKGISSQQ